MIAYDGAMTSTSDRSPNGPSVVPPALHSWLIETLEKQGADDKTPRLEPLQTEASFRQFYRVIGANQPLVLMDSPPAKEQNPQFVAIAASFAAQGIRVPTVLAHQADDGWLLLTDLGHTHFMDAYREGNEQQCLQAALTTLGRIAAVDDPVIADYTAGRLSDELDIFVDWLVRDACQIALPDTLFEGARKLLLANAADQPQVCVHRDFHCKNLLWDKNLFEKNKRADSSQLDPVGVLDFQDALRGPAGYDLASLLHDCYWKFSDEIIDDVISKVSSIDRRTLDLLAVQRQLKATGIFARLASRDNKASHLPHITPVLENLITLCSRYKELKPLSQWLADALAAPAKAWVAKTQSAAKQKVKAQTTNV